MQLAGLPSINSLSQRQGHASANSLSPRSLSASIEELARLEGLNFTAITNSQCQNCMIQWIKKG